MTETGSIAKWGGVAAMVRGPLEFFVEQLRVSLRDHVRSITVVGSSLTDDYRSGASDIDTVVVLDKQDISQLAAVASLGGHCAARGCHRRCS